MPDTGGMDSFRCLQEVFIQGLTGERKYNGARGYIESVDEAAGRYEVGMGWWNPYPAHFVVTDSVRVQHANLRLVPGGWDRGTKRAQPYETEEMDEEESEEEQESGDS